MELNDITDYQRCFACGQRNPYGLHLIFRQEENSIVTDFTPREEHQSFPGVIHGGIIATLMDEALSRTTALSQTPTWSMTGRLELRYRQYVPYGQPLRIRARLGKQRGRMLQASGILTPITEETNILAEAQGTFMTLPPQLQNQLMKDYPGLRTFFNPEKNT